MGGDGGWRPCEVASGCYVAERGIARIHVRTVSPVEDVAPAVSLRLPTGYAFDADDCDWLAARLTEAAAAIRAAGVPA